MGNDRKLSRPCMFWTGFPASFFRFWAVGVNTISQGVNYFHGKGGYQLFAGNQQLRANHGRK